MSVLRRISPSNLVILAALPFIVYLFVSSQKYYRSLKAIIGIEDQAGKLLIGFLILFVVLAVGYLSARNSIIGVAPPRWLKLSLAAAVPVHLAFLAIILLLPDVFEPFIESVFYNSLDENTSELIDRSAKPWSLGPELVSSLSGWFQSGAIIYCVAYAAFLLGRRLSGELRKWIVRGFEAISGVLLFYIVFVAYWGFATGIAITLRAAVFAYILSAVFGLIWTGLQSFQPNSRTFPIYGSISILFLAVSAFFFAQPKDTYVLVGSTEARIAIVKGTPQSAVDIVRFGEFDGGEGKSLKIRSAPDVLTALDQIESMESVSGAFVPSEFHSGTHPLLWQTSFLPDSAKTPALAFSVIGFLLLVLTVGGNQHRLHPLAAGAEFFVNTIRGIPMLVIILYIGLPLSGAIKETTQGGIDLSNMTRGVIAISIGYSAYMAEIFRSGIEAIPAGQIEAGKSLGLSRWKTARLIILPQAFRIVIPPLGNEFIAMIKDTSLLSILSVRDVTQRMREFQAASFLPFAPYNTAAILYVIITLACASFLKWIERRTQNTPS